MIAAEMPLTTRTGQEDEDAATLAAALEASDGLEAAPSDLDPGGTWFLFAGASGTAGFRPIRLGGAEPAPPDPEDGPGAARLLEACEGVLADVERALSLSIEPRRIGPAPGGVRLLVGAGSGADALLFDLPAALARVLDAASPRRRVLCRLTLPAPAWPADEAPEPGDLLLLGAAGARLAQWDDPPGAELEITLAEARDARAIRAEADAKAKVTLALRLRLTDLESVRAGAPLSLSDHAATGTATLRRGTAGWTGRLLVLTGGFGFLVHGPDDGEGA